MVLSHTHCLVLLLSVLVQGGLASNGHNYCHNSFLGYFSKLHTFLSKIKVGDVEKACRGGFQKIHKNKTVILDEI
jgi:hypothetical protein